MQNFACASTTTATTDEATHMAICLWCVQEFRQQTTILNLWTNSNFVLARIVLTPCLCRSSTILATRLSLATCHTHTHTHAILKRVNFLYALSSRPLYYLFELCVWIFFWILCLCTSTSYMTEFDRMTTHICCVLDVDGKRGGGCDTRHLFEKRKK